MKGVFLYVLCLVLSVPVTSLNGQWKYSHHEINGFEFSIREDGLIFNAEDGSGLVHKATGIPVLNGMGVTLHTSNYAGIKLLRSHVSTLKEEEYAGFSNNWLNEETGLIMGPARFTEVYEVNRSDILDHISDFNKDGRIDNQIPAIFDWPATGNKHFTEKYGYDTSGLGAHFHDVNGNNIYEPELGEYPTHEHDFLESMIPSKMVLKHFCSDTEIRGNFAPVHLNAAVLIYGYECDHPQMSFFSESALVVQYYLKNHHHGNHSDAHLSFNFLGKLGDVDNEFLNYNHRFSALSFYTDSSSVNTDFKDYVCSIQNTEPALHFKPGVGVFDAQVKSFHHYDLDTSLVTSGPKTGMQLLNLIKESLWSDSTIYSAGDYGYNINAVDKAFFSFDGDLQNSTGWNETQGNNMPGNRNGILTFEPTILPPGTIFKVDFVVSFYKSNDGLPNNDILEKNNEVYHSLGASKPDYSCPDPRILSYASNTTELWSVGPNPTDGWIQIQKLNNPAHIVITDLTGTVIVNDQGSYGFPRFYIENPGIYFVDISSCGLTKRFTVIVM